jgi:uncharacterized membrane protein YphA (DoxX/SURF4 family)
MNSLPPIITPGPAQTNACLLILRIASVPVFLYHGSAILFGAFEGPSPRGFTRFMHMPAHYRLPSGARAYRRFGGKVSSAAEEEGY